MIFFEKELSFVKTYLDIEKVRFDDELEIAFDIATTNFKLPVLTVQPLVENAVKHGTSKKEGTASLTVSTRETEEAYVITVSDTGVGFDPAACQTDGHKHVGIQSVRERLENLCGGTLTVESTPGVGTVATVRVPKRGKEQL
jgi:sensor histidine kinase YesM